MDKRKLNIFSWTMLIIVIIVSTSFVSYRSNKVVCQKINVQISDSLLNRFVDRNDIVSFMKKSESLVFGKPIWDLNTALIENRIENLSFVLNAEAYSDCKGQLNIIVRQKKPIIRVKNNAGGEFYIDNQGDVLPLSGKYASHVLIVNGEISNNVLVNKRKVKDYKNNRLNEIYTLAKFIDSNEFWRAQIQQIYLTSNGEYEMIPRVGAHVILFGSFRDYQNKFKKLMAVYQQGFKYKGWNKYSIINLKFDNQIVCTKI